MDAREKYGTMETKKPELPGPEPPLSSHVPQAKNLAELFANSPFAGLDMDFERDKDFGREIEL